MLVRYSTAPPFLTKQIGRGMKEFQLVLHPFRRLGASLAPAIVSGSCSRQIGHVVPGERTDALRELIELPGWPLCQRLRSKCERTFQRQLSDLAGRTPVEAYRRIGQLDHGGHARLGLMIKQAACTTTGTSSTQPPNCPRRRDHLSTTVHSCGVFLKRRQNFSCLRTNYPETSGLYLSGGIRWFARLCGRQRQF